MINFCRILDFENMAASNHLTLDDWKNADPTHDSNLILYSKYHFLRDGTVNFFLRSPDHSCIESTIYKREDSKRRPVLK